MLNLNQTIHDIIDLLFPPQCLSCKGIMSQHNAQLPACSNCLNRLTPYPKERIAIDILNRLYPCNLEGLFIGFVYDAEIRSLIHALKYQEMPGIGISLGKVIAERTQLPGGNFLHDSGAATSCQAPKKGL